jgi:hypothetical protein
VTDDIVTRLHRHNHDWLPTVHTPCDYCDALAEIERLRALGDNLADESWNNRSADEAVAAWWEARRG